MRTGFCFQPGRFGQNGNRNEQSWLAEGQRACSPVPPQGPTPDYRAPVDPTAPDASGMSPQGYCRENLAGTHETCQRARVYLGKNCFSCARTDMLWPLANSGLTRAAAPARPALLTDPPDTLSSSISTRKQDAPEGCANEKLFSAPDGPFSGSSQWIRHQKDESRGGFLAGGNGELRGKTSSRSSGGAKAGFAPQSFQGDQAGAGPPLNGHQSDCSGTSPPPSAVAERTGSSYSICPPSSPQPSPPCSNSKSWEKQLFVSEGVQRVSHSPSFAPAHGCDSFHSSESSLLLPEDKRDRGEESLSRSPHRCRVGSSTADHNVTSYLPLCATGTKSEDALPAVRSALTSPHRRSWRRLLSWSPGSSERKEEDIHRNRSLQVVNGNRGNSSAAPQHGFKCPGEVVKPAPLAEPQVPPSSEKGTEPSSPPACAEGGSGSALDEVTAYERDILLVDVTQDDAELFENVPQKSVLKLGPVRFSEDLKCRPLGRGTKHQLNSNGAPVELGQR